ncbi:MAG: DsbA family protein [Solirubrobacteraceae bacterium]
MGAGDRENGVEELLAGIPQSAARLGDPQAPVALDYFGDLQCPYCREFSLRTLPGLIQRWVRAGKLSIQYRALETATQDPDVFVSQQVAALAAGRQQKTWDFIEIFYVEQGEENSGYVTDAFLRGIAGQVAGLDLAQWTEDRQDPELAKTIVDDGLAAQSAGLRGTPSFLIGRTGGTMTTFEPADTGSFDTTIEELSKPAS